MRPGRRECRQDGQSERGADRRALIAGFPAQMASLAGPLTDFINEAFGASRLDAAPLLRGVYFTSGTQEGTPVDRLTATMAFRRQCFHPACSSSHLVKASGEKSAAGAEPKRSTKGTQK